MQEIIQLIISALTLIGIVFAIYRFFRDPDVKSAEEISLIKERCELRHQFIDENLVMIKENHLNHLESDVAQLRTDMTRVLTILEERFKK